MFYFEILNAMEERSIKYLVVGGLAVNLYNVQRMTNDIDFLIKMDQGNVLKFVHLMRDMGYTPRLPVNPELLADQKTLEEWVSNKNMTAFSFFHSRENYKVIDIIISHPLDFEKAYEKRLIKNINNIQVSLVSLDDLITMKMVSGRGKDLEDINKLKEAKQIEEGMDTTNG